MRTVRHILTALLLGFTLTTCSKDSPMPAPPVTPEGDGAFEVRIRIPEMKQVDSRAAVEEGMIDNLQVLVFDENGAFLSRSEAIAPTSDPGFYRVLLPKTDPNLPASRKKRTVHFIANVDWSRFSDVANEGKNQNEVLMGLSTTGQWWAYWQWVELPSGIEAGAFSAPVELICNMARISVLNNTVANPSAGLERLTDVTFALGDYLDHGTVAPFDRQNGVIDPTKVIESPDGVRRQTQPGDFVNQAGVGEYPNAIVECYEHENASSATPMYVILKCLYGDDAEYSYYKIDIVGKGQQTLLDIQRNCHYMLNITEVSGQGHKTLQEAMASPASNNLIYSVLLEKYTAIAYGDAALYVETTERTYVKPNENFRISFNYFPDTELPENNASIQFALNQDNTRPVTASLNIIRTNGDARLEGRTAASLPVNGYNTAEITIYSEESGVKLQRVIRLHLRKPTAFGNPYLNPARIPSTAKQPVNLHFTIPEEVPASWYPIEVYMTVSRLSPLVTETINDGLTLEHFAENKYRFKYLARRAGDHTIHFQTILSQNPEGQLLLESPLFSSFPINLNGT